MKPGYLKKFLLLFLVLTFSNTGEIEAEVGRYCCRYTETLGESFFGITQLRGVATVGPVITIPSSGTGPEGGLGASQDINVCEANCRTEVLGFGLGICNKSHSSGWYEYGTVRGFWEGTLSLCFDIPYVGDIPIFKRPYFKTFAGSMCNGCCMI